MSERRQRVAALPPTVGIKDAHMRRFADALASAWAVRNDGSGAEGERFVRRGEIAELASEAVVQVLAGAAVAGAVALTGNPTIDYQSVARSVNDIVTSSKAYEFLRAPVQPIQAPTQKLRELSDRINVEQQERLAQITNEADARVAAILAEANARGVAVSDLQTQINTIVAAGTSDTSTILAALQEEQTARVQGDTAEANRTNTLAVQLRGDYAGTNPAMLTQGILFNERKARIDADSVIVSSIDALTARAAGNEAAINNEMTVRANAVSAVSLRVDSLSSRVGQAEANVLDEQETRSSKDNALAQALNTIWASVGGGEALIQDGQLAAVTPAAVSATKWQQVQAAVTDPNTGAVSTTSIKQDLAVYASKVDGTLNSTWGIRSNVNGYITGVSLMTQQGAGSNPGASTSHFMVMADRFSLVNPNNNALRPVPLSVDGWGNAVFGGIIYATGGTFAGALNAASGTFLGELRGATGWFSGSLTTPCVYTDNIVGAAISATYSQQSSGTSASVTVDIPEGSRSLVVMAFFGGSVAPGRWDSGSKATTQDRMAPCNGSISSPLGSTSNAGSTSMAVLNPPRGVFTITASRSHQFPSYDWPYFVGNVSIVVILVKR